MSRQRELLIGTLLLTFVGCGTASSKPETPGDYQASHGISEHHPQSFAAAVDQLGLRRDALLSSEPPPDVPRALQELKDIVRWLPELAGDSDLLRADWEAVQRAALELQQLTEAWQTREHVAEPKTRSQYDALVLRLRPLTEKSVIDPHAR